MNFYNTCYHFGARVKKVESIDLFCKWNSNIFFLFTLNNMNLQSVMQRNFLETYQVEFPSQTWIKTCKTLFSQDFLGFWTRYKRHRLKVAGIARTLLLGTPFEQITAFVLIYTLGFTKSWSPNPEQNKTKKKPSVTTKRVAVLLSAASTQGSEWACKLIW